MVIFIFEGSIDELSV